jgi:hypothetical protein
MYSRSTSSTRLSDSPDDDVPRLKVGRRLADVMPTRKETRAAERRMA